MRFNDYHVGANNEVIRIWRQKLDIQCLCGPPKFVTFMGKAGKKQQNEQTVVWKPQGSDGTALATPPIIPMQQATVLFPILKSASHLSATVTTKASSH